MTRGEAETLYAILVMAATIVLATALVCAL